MSQPSQPLPPSTPVHGGSAGQAPADGPFPHTDWSLVGRAAHRSATVKRMALDGLLRQYLPALRVYLLARRRCQPGRVDDLLQGFVAAKVLEQDLVARADRNRGRFRALLLTSLDHYVLGELRRDRAAKRRPAAAALPLDEAVDVPARTAADAFDRAWARRVLDLAVERTRAECAAGGRPDLWGVFEGRVLAATLAGGEPEPLEALVERFGFASARQAFNALLTARRMFARNLRAVVAGYAEDAADVEQEIRSLRGTLSRADGSGG